MDTNRILGLDVNRKRSGDYDIVSENDLVLVTGANSFIGSHIVKLLLDQGYQVRGTVSSLKDESVVKPLQALVPNSKYKLELFEVDLLDEDGWREPLKGCKYVIHTAAPYPDEPIFGNEIDTVDLALNSITNILNACVNHGMSSLRRFVYTSSIGAIAGDAFVDGKTYNESDWPDNFDDLQPYIKSKVVCEKYLWDWVKERLEKNLECFEVSVINPGFVLGPLLLKKTNQSLELIINLLIRDHSMIPGIFLPVTDVRDVALAHVRAIKLPEAAFKRHIVVTNVECVSLKHIAKILDKEFTEYDVPTKVAPDIVIKFFALFDKSLKLLTPSLGHKAFFDNKRMYNILSIEPVELKTTILDTGYSLIAKKLVPEQ